jgi:hypothetical protein
MESIQSFFDGLGWFQWSLGGVGLLFAGFLAWHFGVGEFVRPTLAAAGEGLGRQTRVLFRTRPGIWLMRGLAAVVVLTLVAGLCWWGYQQYLASEEAAAADDCDGYH